MMAKPYHRQKVSISTVAIYIYKRTTTRDLRYLMLKLIELFWQFVTRWIKLKSDGSMQ